MALIFANPFVTTARVEQSLGITNQGARNLLRDAERRGWLADWGSFGRGGRTYWLAQEVLDVIESPAAYAGTSVDPHPDATQRTGGSR